MSPEAFLERVADLAGRAGLPGIGAGILVAADAGEATDSRAFARLLGVAHALVLRDCVALEEAGLITVERRDARTHRLFYSLTPAGRALL
jgi:DNA-binding MarR family transcriptional regulator